MLLERRWHLTSPELAATLRAELARAFPSSTHAAVFPEVVESRLREDALAPEHLAFASQALANVEDVTARSIQEWARVLFERIAERLHGHAGPWRLHVLALGETSAGRSRLIEQALIEQVRERRRRLERSRVADAEQPWQRDEALVQVALVSASSGVLSVALPSERRRLERTLSRFPRGRVEAPRDARPPSRAYRKLLEAEVHLGHAIARGETCVDLGASPGGWSYVALERGAHVTAVDRSPLRDDLMQSPRLTFIRGDAFSWLPERPVDWLLCDLIAFPERSVALLETWLARRLCRRFVVTLKFRGEADLDRVEAAQTLLHRHAAGARLLHLAANKNEVTVLGEVAPRVRAILFDLDGVLVRSRDAWAHLISLAGERFRGRAVSRDDFEPTFGQSTADDVAAFGLRCSPEELDAFYVEHFASFAKHLWVDPDAGRLLGTLRARGLKQAVVTNCPTPLARRILEAAGLLGAVDAIAAVDAGLAPKPAPDLVERALRELGVSASEAWLVGDSRFDRGAAAAAGVRFAGLGMDGDVRLTSLAEVAQLTAP